MSPSREIWDEDSVYGVDHLIVACIGVNARENHTRIDSLAILVTQLQFSSVIDHSESLLPWRSEECVIGSQDILGQEWIPENEVIEQDLIELIRTKSVSNFIDSSFPGVADASE